MPRIVAGSWPVYDWGTSPQGLPRPPGQNVHLPWGHLLGAVITATGVTPEMVRTGFVSRMCWNDGISAAGSESRISILVGIDFRRCFLAMSRFRRLSLACEVMCCFLISAVISCSTGTGVMGGKVMVVLKRLMREKLQSFVCFEGGLGAQKPKC